MPKSLAGSCHLPKVPPRDLRIPSVAKKIACEIPRRGCQKLMHFLASIFDAKWSILGPKLPPKSIKKQAKKKEQKKITF